MKRMIIYWVSILALVLPGTNLYAQPPKLTAAFSSSFGIVVDSKGNAFVTGKNNRVIKITPAGKAELFAGGARNNKDGKGKDAGFGDTRGIAIDAADNLYLADHTRIRKITPEGLVSTLAGGNSDIMQDGNIATASFHRPEWITVDNIGNIYVT